MKKTLLLLTFACVVLLGYSQNGCSVDPQYTSPGIYPDTAVGLAPAYVGMDYSENITIITPLDTTVVFAGLNLEFTVDSINLTSVTGLPYGFSYGCNPPTCSFPGGTAKCAELYSTVAPDDSLIGIHNIIFSTTTYAYNSNVGQIPQDDMIDYYFIEISAVTSTISKIDNTTFELKGVYPNPVMNQARIQFVSGVAENVIFKTYNLLGEEIESQFISSSRGVNSINLNKSLYSEGIYLYSINNGNKVLTKRMIVKN